MSAGLKDWFSSQECGPQKLFPESQDRETERGLSRIIHFFAAC